MEPKLICDQVNLLRCALESITRQIKEKDLKLEDVFLHSDLVLHQINALEYAVGDGVTLRGICGNDCKSLVTNAHFWLKQVENMQIAVRDNAHLQTTSSGSTVKLSTMSSQFVLDIVQMLEDVVCDNAKIVMERDVDLNTLNMSKPSFVKMTVGWLLRLMHCHTILLETVVSCREARRNAETSLGKLTQDYKQLFEEHEAAGARMAELEDALRRLEDEKTRLQAAADAADGAAQARLDQINSELESRNLAHFACDSRLQGQEAEIKEGLKKLIISHEQQAEAAAESASQLALKKNELQAMTSERDRLTAELIEVQKNHDTSLQTRAQGQLQTSQLQTALQKQIHVSEALERENASLQATVEKYDVELRTTKEQLLLAEIQSDTWRTTAEDVLARPDVELAVAQNLAVRQREEREADDLLQKAARKIEELERLVLSKDQEVAKLREEQGPLTPISPPPSQKLSKKRAFAGAEKAKANSSLSEGNQDVLAHLAATASPLSPERTRELASFPEIPVDLGSQHASPVIFSRSSLNHILGGSCQGLIVRIASSATELAQKHDVQGFLCPNMDHNAWSPASPGKHGYMQVGLGRDAAYFNEEGEYRHVFIGIGKCYVYCGYYHALRVEPLTRKEWDTLPEKVKATYSATTVNKDRTGNFKSAVQVLKLYSEGKLLAPCVRLQCLKFDTEFYQDLVRANDQYFSNKPRPALVKNKSVKRRRVSNGKLTDDESADDMPLALAASSNTHSSSSTYALAAAIDVNEFITSQPVIQVTATGRRQSDVDVSPLTLRRRSLRSCTQTSNSAFHEEPLNDEVSSLSDDDDLYANY